jgi:hypothetical protein
MMEATRSSETRFLEEPSGVTSQKTAFFMFTTMFSICRYIVNFQTFGLKNCHYVAPQQYIIQYGSMEMYIHKTGELK